jgi:hypothetical protein
MKLSDVLRDLAKYPMNSLIRPYLQAAADRIDESRLWRDAWLKAEKRVEELTKELESLR